MDRGKPLIILQVDFSPESEQSSGHFLVVIAYRVMKWAVPKTVHDALISAGLKQLLDHLEQLLSNGHMQNRLLI